MDHECIRSHFLPIKRTSQRRVSTGADVSGSRIHMLVVGNLPKYFLVTMSCKCCVCVCACSIAMFDCSRVVDGMQIQLI